MSIKTYIVHYHGSSQVQPSMFIVEVLLSGIVDLVRQFVQSEHERQVREPSHLHLRGFCSVAIQRQQQTNIVSEQESKVTGHHQSP